MTLRGFKGRSGSRPNGGANDRPHGCAIITASRTAKGAATGSIAKACSAMAAAALLSGTSTACSDEQSQQKDSGLMPEQEGFARLKLVRTDDMPPAPVEKASYVELGVATPFSFL